LQRVGPMSPTDFTKHQETMRSDARALARQQIAARIRRVCEGLSEAEFNALVDKMAGVQCKYEQMNGDPAALHQVLDFLSARTTPPEHRKAI
jgi:hypothetical protein